LINTQKLITLN